MKKLILILLLLLIPTVYSIGIAPAYKEIFFEPGKELDLSFRILNNERKDMDILIYAKGELANNIELPTNVKLKSDELEKIIDYKVMLPHKLTPGTNILSIYAVESNIQKDDIDVVKTNLGVVYKLKVIVPYPGEYLQGMMFVEGNMPNKPILFTLSLNNLGTESLNDIKGTIVIRNPEGKGVSQIVTSTASLASKEKGKITGEWISTEVGRYVAQAVISYNEEVLLIEKEIDVGEALITIKDIRVVRFKLGDIARLDVLLENNWNENIPDVLTKTVIYDESSIKISESDSSPVDISQASIKEVPSYWETAGVEPGNYVIDIILEYLGKRNEKSYQVTATEDSLTFDDGLTGNVVSQGNAEKFNPLNLLILLIIPGIWLVVYMQIKQQKKVSINKSEIKKENKINDSARKEIDPKIMEYLRYNMKQGISIKALKQKLLSSGYEEEYIDQAILEIEDEKID